MHCGDVVEKPHSYSAVYPLSNVELKDSMKTTISTNVLPFVLA